MGRGGRRGWAEVTTGGGGEGGTGGVCEVLHQHLDIVVGLQHSQEGGGGVRRIQLVVLGPQIKMDYYTDLFSRDFLMILFTRA